MININLNASRRMGYAHNKPTYDGNPISERRSSKTDSMGNNKADKLIKRAQQF